LKKLLFGVLLLSCCFSWGQSIVTFVIQKPKVNPLDTIIACHGNLFYYGEMKHEIPNLRGLGTHYHDLNFAWIDFNKSTFNLVQDTGAFITENHRNGHLYWLDTETDVFNNVFALDSFLLDSIDGSWRGFREDTLSKKNILKINITLKGCGIEIEKTKGYYKKDYLYKYTLKDKFNIEVSKWKLSLKNPKITWITIGDEDVKYFEKSIPKSVLKPYKQTLNYQ